MGTEESLILHVQAPVRSRLVEVRALVLLSRLLCLGFGCFGIACPLYLRRLPPNHTQEPNLEQCLNVVRKFNSEGLLAETLHEKVTRDHWAADLKLDGLLDFVEAAGLILA